MKAKHTLLRVVSLLLLLLLSTVTLLSCRKAGGADTTAEDGLSAIWQTATYRADATIGDGATTVTFKVTADDHTVTLTLRTDAATLADALLGAGLCEGETSQYGLMVSHVNGIRADYDLDGGYWWNLLVEGEASMVGASAVPITAGGTYEFVRTK